MRTEVTEKVDPKPGGVVFVVEGRGPVPGQGEVPAKLVHEATGVVSHEIATSEIRTPLLSGRRAVWRLDFEPE